MVEEETNINKPSTISQTAEKIINVKKADVVNIGPQVPDFVFNEKITKELILAIEPYSEAAQEFLNQVKNRENWESKSETSDEAKDIITSSFIGVIGIQLFKLFAIGKEDPTIGKANNYIEKCIFIAKRSLDLVNFTLLCNLWDVTKENKTILKTEEKNQVKVFFKKIFEDPIKELFSTFDLLLSLHTKNSKAIELPFPELVALSKELIKIQKTCDELSSLNDKLDQSKIVVKDCLIAEELLADFLSYFSFLSNYKMASIREIDFEQFRNIDPKYLHKYTDIGINDMNNLNSEKYNSSSNPVLTKAILIYSGQDFQKSVNLFPFIIDLNVLELKQGSKICFYKVIKKENLKYTFLDQNTDVWIEKENNDFDVEDPKWLKKEENRIIYNKKMVLSQFSEAADCLCG